MDSQTGNSLGSDYQNIWRSRARQGPNFIALGAEELSEEALTSWVVSSGALLELQMICGLRFCCYTEARREIQRSVTNRRMLSYTVNAVLKPRRERYKISVRKKSVTVAARVEV